jgi:hypothetical protein
MRALAPKEACQGAEGARKFFEARRYSELSSVPTPPVKWSRARVAPVRS